ncbi:Lrp/AsnC family transcriptional regulator [Shimia ponticola]|uniref:Lrp/AsnC family transcriptional regulator n=1 Tax=Shimia ponticola TaxID=2582893 RepID=UPI0011BD857A|nr:Lrp/AsnC family transcriptional regulator [Shimia ponticola]
MLDDIDRRILRHLQGDPSQPISALADAARVPQATVTRRLDKLRQTGVLLGTEAIINWKALGYAVEVSLRITLDKTQTRAFDDFLVAARKVPEVIEIQTFLGRVDVRLSVIARDMTHYQTLYRDSILTLPHIADIEALMQVASVLDRRELPL